MSRTNNLHQARRWLLTAKEDLAAAQTLIDGEKYSQACFLSQQAGEKAVKSIWYVVDADPWGHSVTRLVTEFPRRDELIDLSIWIRNAAILDKFYIPTRYPNGLPDLTPGQVYGRTDALTGFAAATYLVDSCERLIHSHLQPPGQP